MIGLVDIGGTKMLASVSRDGNKIEGVIRRPTPREFPVENLSALLDEVRHDEKLDQINIATVGPFDRNMGKLYKPPNLSDAWHGLELKNTLGKKYNCPVYLENDANCAALAEAHWGAGAEYSTVMYYTISTGIGGGVVRNGGLVIGQHDTEAGHQVVWPRWLGGLKCECGGYGCVESLASGSAIRKRYGVLPEEITDLHIWSEIGQWLGIAIANTIALVDPSIIVLGGSVCLAWDKFFASMDHTVRESVHLQPVPPIVRAKLGEG